MSLLADAKKITRSVRRTMLEAKKDVYVSRIHKRIMKCAAEGETQIEFCKVPSRQEYLAVDQKLFIEIAKHFSSLGFDISYYYGNTTPYKFQGDKAKFPNPYGRTSFLNICWE